MQNKGKFRFKCKSETKSSGTDAILPESSTLDAKQFPKQMQNTLYRVPLQMQKCSETDATKVPKQMQNTNAINWFSESYRELYISYMIYIFFL